MAFLIPSYIQGLVSADLAAILNGRLGNVILKGPSPTMSAAFVYGVGAKLTHQGIVLAAKQIQEKYQLKKYETIGLTVAVIAFQMFSNYGVASQLNKHLQTSIPKAFIHTENVLFLAGVLQIDFELTAQQINDDLWQDVTDTRFISASKIELRIHEFFDLLT